MALDNNVVSVAAAVVVCGGGCGCGETVLVVVVVGLLEDVAEMDGFEDDVCVGDEYSNFLFRSSANLAIYTWEVCVCVCVC